MGGDPVTVGAAGSDWLRPRLGRTWRAGRVAGVTPRAVYVVIDPSAEAAPRTGVLAVEGPDAVGLPNGVVLADGGVFDRVRQDQRVAVDGRGLVGPGWSVRITRWRRSRPRPAAAGPDAARARLADLGATARRPQPAAWPDPDPRLVAGAAGLVAVLAPARPVSMDDSVTPRSGDVVDGLLGYGPGSTPSGDDVLAGLLATVAVLAPVWGRPESWDRLQSVIAAVRSRAGSATTALSVTLLDCAIDGAMARPAAAVLDALTAPDLVHATLGSRLDELARIGHTSGRDLALGIVAAGLALTECEELAAAGRAGSTSRPTTTTTSRRSPWSST